MEVQELILHLEKEFRNHNQHKPAKLNTNICVYDISIKYEHFKYMRIWKLNKIWGLYMIFEQNPSTFSKTNENIIRRLIIAFNQVH